uniref:Uncharacterized protein n=1 Tax=viral metagenome TaxID=1070528 RepID=A0A6C0ACM4_9ZZZZ
MNNKIIKKCCSVCLEEKLIYKCSKCCFSICGQCFLKYNKKTCGICGLNNFSEICKLYICYKKLKTTGNLKNNNSNFKNKINNIDKLSNKNKSVPKKVYCENICFEDENLCYTYHQKYCVQCCETYKWEYKKDQYEKLNPKKKYVILNQIVVFGVQDTYNVH